MTDPYTTLSIGDPRIYPDSPLCRSHIMIHVGAYASSPESEHDSGFLVAEDDTYREGFAVYRRPGHRGDMRRLLRKAREQLGPLRRGRQGSQSRSRWTCPVASPVGGDTGDGFPGNGRAQHFLRRYQAVRARPYSDRWRGPSLSSGTPSLRRLLYKRR